MFPFVSRKKHEALIYKLECLLWYATGGKLSKHTYPIDIMEMYVSDYINELCEEAVAEAKGE